MAVQFLPFIKAVAPYIAQVATVAIPAFTSKTTEETKADAIVIQQITELQTAVTQNAQSVHILAEKLQQVIEGLVGKVSGTFCKFSSHIAKCNIIPIKYNSALK